MKITRKLCLVIVFSGLALAFSFQPSPMIQSETPTPDTTTTPETPVPIVEIKVAIMAPFSGNMAVYGKSLVNGVMMVVNDWNDSHAENGWKIVPVYADTKCDPKTTISEANRLIHEETITYFIGDVCSEASVALADILDQSGALQISPAASSPMLTIDSDGNGRRFVFRTCYLDRYQAQAMARYLVLNGFKKAVILANSDDMYSYELAEAFANTYTGEGGTILMNSLGISADKDFSGILTRVRDLNPDVIYLPMWSKQLNLVASQIQTAGIKAQLAGPDSWEDRNLIKSVVEKGLYSTNFSINNPRPEAVEFVKTYQLKTGKRPDMIAALGYDTASLLLTAFDNVGKNNVVKVRDALEELELTGVTGMIRFDDFHNPKKPVVISQYNYGRSLFVTEVPPKD
ncbi:ABC transporter substrate-binding protein [Leptolinea tardivitalis]|uniref:Leucine-binding protein domain-containing protein n=1 Tax=Leptolinea tardivitalis TaxID=229920 RepID=A0A0P6WKG8_9CHLR|nr:ABC transporter substrate-binding protein [Leptolinea tardivitalis]KPL70235.1 hypothetical protein ADM99_13730 [Leptolinea tardivitalis]GAP21781.1 ABC-type branched-chain amino acid transport systems, periplasmic component [Leptolinea tardivitalis]